MNDVPLDESRGTWRVLEQSDPPSPHTPNGHVGGQSYPSREAAINAVDFAVCKMTDVIDHRRWPDGTITVESRAGTTRYTAVWVSPTKQMQVASRQVG